MKDLLGLMGKAKEMQAKFQAMQEEIADAGSDRPGRRRAGQRDAEQASSR